MGLDGLAIKLDVEEEFSLRIPSEDFFRRGRSVICRI